MAPVIERMWKGRCPPEGLLRAYIAGDLDDEASRLVAAHLGECDGCRARVAELRSRPDGRPGSGGRPIVEGLEPPENYEVLGLLGRGGMGAVYEARDLRLNRIVALKVIREDFGGGRELFRGEAETVARLQHPNIVQIFEVGEVGGRPFLALELVRGPSLDRVLEGRPQPPRSAAALLAIIAAAVEHAHRQGVVHRDLKPANILLQSDDGLGPTPKITDFGIAKRLDPDDPGPAAGEILGTPAYMAPEQAVGESGLVGPEADVYSLGVVLYELLTGRTPFRGANILETLELARTQEPVPPRKLQLRIPRDLETICLKCLEKDPCLRYPTASELAEDLGRFRRGEPVAARRVGRLERVVESLARSENDRQLRSWGNSVLLLGPLMALPNFAVTALALTRPGSVWGLWPLALISLALSLAAARRLGRTHAGPEAGTAVRQFLTILTGHLLAVAAVFALCPLVFNRSEPLGLLKVMPFVAVLTGQMYYSLGAAYWGGFYLAGLACLGVALVMPIDPAWAPAEFGALILLIFTAEGLHLRRLGLDDGDDAIGPVASNATTDLASPTTVVHDPGQSMDPN